MATGFLSPWHIAIFVMVVLLVFGPKKLPELGRSLGKGIREFKDSVSMTNADASEDASSASTAMPTLTAAPSVDRARDRDAV